MTTLNQRIYDLAIAGHGPSDIEEYLDVAPSVIRAAVSDLSYPTIGPSLDQRIHDLALAGHAPDTIALDFLGIPRGQVLASLQDLTKGPSVSRSPIYVFAFAELHDSTGSPGGGANPRPFVETVPLLGPNDTVYVSRVMSYLAVLSAGQHVGPHWGGIKTPDGPFWPYGSDPNHGIFWSTFQYSVIKTDGSQIFIANKLTDPPPQGAGTTYNCDFVDWAHPTAHVGADLSAAGNQIVSAAGGAFVVTLDLSVSIW